MPRFSKRVWRKVPRLSSGKYSAWFPNMPCLFPFPTVVRRVWIISSGFPDRNKVQLLHTDAVSGKHHSSLHMRHTADQLMLSVLRHQEVLNFLCLSPWLQTAAKLRPRCPEFPVLELYTWSADAQTVTGWIATRVTATSDLLHIQQWQNGENLTIPPEMGMYPRKHGTQTQPLPRGDWGSDLQSQLSQHKRAKSLNPKHSYRNDSSPSFPTYSEQVLLFVRIRTFVSELKNRCHIQNTSIFVFLNVDGNNCTT